MSWPINLEGTAALVAGGLLGVAFGFLLERGGLGDPRKLTGLFYLTDFTMLQVMFTAIAVTAAGLGVLTAVGVVDLASLAIQPTYLWPQLVGGAILGAGFALGGY
ncbi:MAG: YeeE/YedE family protein [Candidatus Rokubacteria bacterium]|nr:YeeE/YedE family protein [Candidatus Rokubacteria bacterium]